MKLINRVENYEVNPLVKAREGPALWICLQVKYSDHTNWAVDTLSNANVYMHGARFPLHVVFEDPRIFNLASILFQKRPNIAFAARIMK